MNRIFSRIAGAALLLVSAHHANATSPVILAACSEDISCIFQGTVAIDATSGHFTASYARLDMVIGNGLGSTTVPPPNRIQTNTFSAASSDFWSSAKFYQSSSGNSSNFVFMDWEDAGTTRLVLRATGTTQQIKLTTRNAAGTLTDLATATGSICASATICKIDVHIVYATSGSVDVYSNGVNILTYSGDVTTNSATTLNQFDVSHINSGGGVTMGWSEIIVSDSDTRSMKMVTCVASAAGATQNWTGSAGNINANSYNDATFNYTTTNNDLSQWTTGCTIPSLSAILDVRSYGRLAIGASGPQNARYSLHIGGSDYDNGADLTGLTTSFANLKYDWGATSPASGTAWTNSDLTSSFSFGVKSRP